MLVLCSAVFFIESYTCHRHRHTSRSGKTGKLLTPHGNQDATKNETPTCWSMFASFFVMRM